MTKIQTLIQTLEKPFFPFTPNRQFFQQIGIGQRRFWQIVRGDGNSATIAELQKVGKYFGVDWKELTEDEKL